MNEIERFNEMIDAMMEALKDAYNEGVEHGTYNCNPGLDGKNWYDSNAKRTYELLLDLKK